jgi:TRAP-type C4-dicarboxylate transport system permease small subunit
MKGVLGVAEGLYRLLLTIMAIVLFCVVGASVFTRYFLNSSLGWADELSRFTFIWISFLGAAYAYAYDEHLGLDFVVDRIRPARLQLFVRLFGDISIGAVILVITIYGWTVADSATNLSPALYIPMKWVYMIVPATGAFMAVLNLAKIAGRVMALFGHDAGAGRHPADGTEGNG